MHLAQLIELYRQETARNPRLDYRNPVIQDRSKTSRPQGKPSDPFFERMAKRVSGTPEERAELLGIINTTSDALDRDARVKPLERQIAREARLLYYAHLAEIPDNEIPGYRKQLDILDPFRGLPGHSGDRGG